VGERIVAPVYETGRLVKGPLSNSTALIGFCGAPWTLATYMVAGEGTTEQASARQFACRDPEAFQQLIDRLAQASIEYLSDPLNAGADVVQVCDTWAGVL